jgi:predicted Zn-dependent peptidase
LSQQLGTGGDIDEDELLNELEELNEQVEDKIELDTKIPSNKVEGGEKKVSVKKKTEEELELEKLEMEISGL